MNASQELLTLLQDILNGECGRSSLAKWLAERSLRFLESPDEVDRMIVADLDAALGEIQRGAENEEFLMETASQLARGLRLVLPEREIVVDMSNFPLDITTRSTNSGGRPITTVELEAVPRAS